MSFPEENDYRNLFNRTFEILNNLLPNGIVRGNRVNITPLILFEAISIGVADLIVANEEALLNTAKLQLLLNDVILNRLTTGATNSRIKLNQRIDFVKDNLRE